MNITMYKRIKILVIHLMLYFQFVDFVEFPNILGNILFMMYTKSIMEKQPVINVITVQSSINPCTPSYILISWVQVGVEYLKKRNFGNRPEKCYKKLKVWNYCYVDKNIKGNTSKNSWKVQLVENVNLQKGLIVKGNTKLL